MVGEELTNGVITLLQTSQNFSHLSLTVSSDMRDIVQGLLREDLCAQLESLILIGCKNGSLGEELQELVQQHIDNPDMEAIRYFRLGSCDIEKEKLDWLEQNVPTFIMND